MNKLIEAAEAAVGALENFVDRKVDAGEDGTGVQAIVNFLKEEIKAEKKTITVGTHKITEADLYRQIVDAIPKGQFAEIVGRIEMDLNKVAVKRA